MNDHGLRGVHVVGAYIVCFAAQACWCITSMLLVSNEIENCCWSRAQYGICLPLLIGLTIFGMYFTPFVVQCIYVTLIISLKVTITVLGLVKIHLFERKVGYWYLQELYMLPHIRKSHSLKAMCTLVFQFISMKQYFFFLSTFWWFLLYLE